MLKRADSGETLARFVYMREAAYPAPFHAGLEYAPPARGTWNIVHTGMLVPEAHEIFVCAEGCLRGVVLTAAEMGAMERFSTIAIREENVIRGDMEELIIDGVSDILSKLTYTPRAVLVYTSCIHHFMASDLERVYGELRARFPKVRFMDCYMDPIMRKSGLTPDQTMRRQLYGFLEKQPLDESRVSIIGNDFTTDETSELVTLIRRAHKTLCDITLCRTFDEYMALASSALDIATYPAAAPALEALHSRLGQDTLYIPQSFDYDEIGRSLRALAVKLGTVYTEAYEAEGRARADAALYEAKRLIGDTPIVLDYTAFARPFELAKLLIGHGFDVREIYADSVSSEDKAAFMWLKANAGDIALYPTADVSMRVASHTRAEKTLAIGQKAAYFTGSRNFVNVVEGGGLYGYDGVARLAALMRDAYENERDTRALIGIKGLGCAGGGCLI